MRRAVLSFCFLLSIALPAGIASASWLDALVRGGRATKSVVAHGAGTLESAGLHIRALPVRADRGVIAATGSHEGHWRFVNRSGEVVTAANADEISRALGVLAPESTKGGKLAIYLTEDTAYQFRPMLKDLPRSAEIHVVVGNDAFRLTAHGEGQIQRLFAEVRPNLAVEMAERWTFEEAIWQLARPLNKSNIRVIALEPGAPTAISTVPRFDRVTKRAETDVIDPDRLRQSLSAIRNQTALITGRVEGELLFFRPTRGPERSLALPELLAAAEANDVNLIVLRSSTPRQPGARNWLWQQVAVENLDQAISRATMSDFLDALAGSSRMLVEGTPSGALRTTLELRPSGAIAGGNAPSSVTTAFNEVLVEVTGKVVLHGVTAIMRSSERERELEARLIPGVPSEIQNFYFGSMILGLFGWATLRSWWQRLWPPETAAEYGSIFGYRSAWAVRGLAFGLIFLPLAGTPAFVVQVSRVLWDQVTRPIRWLARKLRSA